MRRSLKKLLLKCCCRPRPIDLLEQDSEMHKAIKAFGGSTETDTESDRSISPPPTLRGLNEKEKIHEATEISTSGNGEASTSAAAHRVPGTTSGCKSNFAMV